MVTEIVSFIVVKSVEKDEILFREGEASQGFYVVQKGIICVHQINAAGKSITINSPAKLSTLLHREHGDSCISMG